MFCAQCEVPWHAGMKCEKFRKLNKNEKNSEDMKLIKLAEEKKWKRCLHCNYFVERTAGCLYKTCRSAYTITLNNLFCN